MALISGTTIITSISLFHITLAFFFLTNPSTIADQALVWVLGSSMGMPHVRGFETRSPQLALLSIVLTFMGISDLTSLSMPEEISQLYYWGSQAPLRLFLSLVVVMYTFFTGASGPLSGPSQRNFSHNPAHPSSSSWGGDGLKNDVIFAFAFVEMITWFWVWITLREERGDLVRRSLKEKRRERDDRDD